MTVKELRSALPYNKDGAEVLIAPPGCLYGTECAVASVLDSADNCSKERIVIVAKQPYSDYNGNKIKEKRPAK